MSFFDPHKVYYHHQKSTKKGQIIQKKPQPKNGAIGYDEIPRSITVLKTFKYQVYPPNFSITKSFHRDLSWNYNQNNNNISTIAISVNSIISGMGNKFNQFFDIDPTRVQNFYFYINLNTILFNINPSSSSSSSYTLSFYENPPDGNQLISFTTSTHGTNFIMLFPYDINQINHCRIGDHDYFNYIPFYNSPTEIKLASYLSNNKDIYTQMFNNQFHEIDDDQDIAIITLSNSTSDAQSITYSVIMDLEYI